jgi:urease accessory protein
MALVGVFALFHGHAHGAEMPETASGMLYGLGFMLATALLHVAGIALGFGAAALAGDKGRLLTRFGGGAVAACGLFVLAGAL